MWIKIIKYLFRFQLKEPSARFLWSVAQKMKYRKGFIRLDCTWTWSFMKWSNVEQSYCFLTNQLLIIVVSCGAVGLQKNNTFIVSLSSVINAHFILLEPVSAWFYLSKDNQQLICQSWLWLMPNDWWKNLHEEKPTIISSVV